MAKTVKIISVLILLTASFMTGVGLTYNLSERRFHKSLANILLHELSNNIKISDIIDIQIPQLKKINSQLNKNILETVLSISVIDPDPQKLDSISLETLCLVTQLNNQGHFDDVVIAGAEDIALDYLKKIEVPIANEISRLQKLFKGEGCSTTLKRK